MAKREDIEAQIAELQKQLEDNGDDDYEIEIRDGDKATRLPKSAGVPWLKRNFPDLFEELLGEGSDDDDQDDGKPGKTPKADPRVVPAHFGRSRRSS